MAGKKGMGKSADGYGPAHNPRPLVLTELSKEGKLLLIERLAMTGMTQKNLADVFGVEVRTVVRWFENDPEMRRAWERGRVHPDHQVEQALFRRAIGYQYKQTEEERGSNGQLLRRKVQVREMPPEVIAQIFWLKNRLPHLWQDKVSHEVTVRDLMELGNKHRDRNIPGSQQEDPACLSGPEIQDAEIVEIIGDKKCSEIVSNASSVDSLQSPPEV